ncbi:MAG: hypothetical protein ABGY24_14485 [bacterium]
MNRQTNHWIVNSLTHRPPRLHTPTPPPQKEFERRVDPNDKNAQNLLDEMRQHVKKLEDMRKNEDPRLSFSTPEFKEAQRTFTDGFKKNFGKPITYGLVKDYAWSTPQLRKLVRSPFLWHGRVVVSVCISTRRPPSLPSRRFAHTQPLTSHARPCRTSPLTSTETPWPSEEEDQKRSTRSTESVSPSDVSMIQVHCCKNLVA